MDSWQQWIQLTCTTEPLVVRVLRREQVCCSIHVCANEHGGSGTKPEENQKQAVRMTSVNSTREDMISS